MHASRLNALQEKMKEQAIDAFLVTSNASLYYYTGSAQAGYLWVPAEGEPVFYVRRSLRRAQEESACRTEALGSFSAFGETLRKASPHVFAGPEPVVAADLDMLPAQLFLRLQTSVSGVRWEDGSRLIREQRMIKSEEEIRRIREASRIANRGLEKVLELLREGMSDLELSALYEYEVRKLGHGGLIRVHGYNGELVIGLVASGEDAAVPTGFDGPAGGRGLSAAFPGGSSRREIRRGDPILFDAGCCYEGYLTDQTRTLVIGGLAPHLQKAYDAAERILEAVEERLRPGTICEDLYELSLRMAEEAGLKNHFMGYGADQVKFLGHGVGLEIDEFPVLAKGFRYPLQPGMVIAIEPKFTFPGEGVVGLENTYLITADGFETLTLTGKGLIRM